jgi:hypothetical protein
MANVKKDALSPLVHDDQTDHIVGVKNSDGSEKAFVYTDGSQAMTGNLIFGTSDNGVTASGAFDIVFRTSGSTERVRFGNSGNVSISNGNLILGTSGNGIDFSATANGSGTMTSELLDDYEEGTWTPAFATSAVNFATMTMDVVSATYTKVGRLVTCTAFIRTDNVDTTSATGAVNIINLPFTSASASHSALLVGDATAWVNAPIAGYIVAAVTTCRLVKAGTNGNTTSLLPADFTTGATADQNSLIFSCSYITA